MAFTPDPNSIVDYLKTNAPGGMNPDVYSSRSNRAKLYEQAGLGKASDYLALGGNNAAANIALLNYYKSGKKSPMNPGIVSSSSARADFNNTATDLNDLATNDPYLTLLQSRLANSQQRQDLAGKQAGAAYKGTLEKTQENYNRYQAGLATLGIKTGASQYTPELQAGLELEAANKETQALADIHQKEQLAIAKARQAQADGDVKLMKEQVEYIRQLRKDKADAIEAELSKRQKDITFAKGIAFGVLDNLAQLSPDQHEAYIQNVARQYKIDPLTLISALSDAKLGKSTREASLARTNQLLSRGQGGGGGGYTKTQLGKLRSANIDPSDTEIADNFLFNDGVSPSKVNKQYLIDNYGKSSVWKLALALGIPRTKNLSKNNEIDALANNAQLFSYVQNMIARGYTINDIIESNQQ